LGMGLGSLDRRSNGSLARQTASPVAIPVSNTVCPSSPLPLRERSAVRDSKGVDWDPLSTPPELPLEQKLKQPRETAGSWCCASKQAQLRIPFPAPGSLSRRFNSEIENSAAARRHCSRYQSGNLRWGVLLAGELCSP